MKNFQGTTQKKYCENSRYSINSITRLIILIAPFAIYVGQFISIMGINISHIYSLILSIYIVNSCVRKKYNNNASYIIFFFIMILYSLASLILGIYSNVGETIFFPLLTGFVTMAFIASFNEKELLLFLKTLSIFTIIVLIMSLFEIFTGRYLFFENQDFIDKINLYYLHYPGALFSNPNDLSQYLLVGFPLLIFMWLEKERRMIVPSVLFLATVFVMINTLSRLSLMSTIGIIAFYSSIVYLTKKNKFVKILQTLLLLVAIIGMFSYFGADFSQFDNINDFLNSDSSQEHYIGRESIYIEEFELGLDNIIFGAGLGGSYAISLIGAHNMFLFIFADLGIFFAIGFAMVLMISFISLYKYNHITICGFHLNAIILSILIIFPMFSSISSGNEQRKIIWIFLGLIFALINNNKKTFQTK